MTRGVFIAAPASGSGKTTITLGLLRHLRRAGVPVSSVKAGPDYIDAAFHTVASGHPCLNLDIWAMRPETVAGLVARAGESADLVIGEGVMGLFDGAVGASAPNDGSTADLSAMTGWPVLLVVDAHGMAASAAALVQGFAAYRRDLTVAGVIFNRVGGGRHTRMLRNACAPLGVPVLGCVPRSDCLRLFDRHLGLVQAGEHADLEDFLDSAAGLVAEHVDIALLTRLARPTRLASGSVGAVLPPLGQNITVARDVAFSFSYPFVLDGWRAAGAAVRFFSPLADEAPDPAADAVFLPGGYPELHTGRLAGNRRFLDGLRRAAAAGALIYGECGGYMVLGRAIANAEGRCYPMAGLLPLETSFATRRSTLGYRRAELLARCRLGPPGAHFRGHEFHYSSVIGSESGAPLFRCRDAEGNALGDFGMRQGTVMGSFLHLIDGEGGSEAAPAISVDRRRASNHKSAHQRPAMSRTGE